MQLRVYNVQSLPWHEPWSSQEVTNLPAIRGPARGEDTPGSIWISWSTVQARYLYTTATGLNQSTTAAKKSCMADNIIRRKHALHINEVWPILNDDWYKPNLVISFLNQSPRAAETSCMRDEALYATMDRLTVIRRKQSSKSDPTNVWSIPTRTWNSSLLSLQKRAMKSIVSLQTPKFAFNLDFDLKNQKSSSSHKGQHVCQVR